MEAVWTRRLIAIFNDSPIVSFGVAAEGLHLWAQTIGNRASAPIRLMPAELLSDWCEKSHRFREGLLTVDGHTTPKGQFKGSEAGKGGRSFGQRQQACLIAEGFLVTFACTFASLSLWSG